MDKMTNVKALEAVIAYAEANADAFPTEVVEKITAIRDTYAKKGTNRKPTARQEENVALKDTILAILTEAEAPLTATQVLDKVAETVEGLTLPRVTAQLTALKEAGIVTRYVDKKKALFVVTENEGE